MFLKEQNSKKEGGVIVFGGRKIHCFFVRRWFSKNAVFKQQIETGRLLNYKKIVYM
jgi:hypothetical protein